MKIFINHHKSNQQGFTLVELMIVIAIIGVLAAIAIPNYLEHVSRSQIVEGIVVSDGLRSEIGVYVWENKYFPNASDVAANGSIGRQASSIDGKFVAKNGVSVAANTGVITVNFDAGSIAGKTLVLTPTINNANNQHVVKWICSGTVGADRLPKSCQN